MGKVIPFFQSVWHLLCEWFSGLSIAQRVSVPFQTCCLVHSKSLSIVGPAKRKNKTHSGRPIDRTPLGSNNSPWTRISSLKTLPPAAFLFRLLRAPSRTARNPENSGKLFPAVSGTELVPCGCRDPGPLSDSCQLSSACMWCACSVWWHGAPQRSHELVKTRLRSWLMARVT